MHVLRIMSEGDIVSEKKVSATAIGRKVSRSQMKRHAACYPYPAVTIRFFFGVGIAGSKRRM